MSTIHKKNVNFEQVFGADDVADTGAGLRVADGGASSMPKTSYCACRPRLGPP